MSAPSVPQLGEALDLIRSIEAACDELEPCGGPDAQETIATLREVVRDIRAQLYALADERPRRGKA
jgi:hypothetical protein